MSVGEELKAARAAKKITLETISQKTKIPVKYLESLEKNEFDVFPSHTYAKSFIRAYSKVVGLDQAVMTRQFNAEVKPKEIRIEPMNVEAEMERGPIWSPLSSLPPVLHRAQTTEDPELEQLREEYSEPFRREPSALRNRRIRAVRRSKGLRMAGTVSVFVLAGVLLAGVIYFTQKGFSSIQWSHLNPPPTLSQPSALTPLVVPDKYQHLVLKGLDKSWVQVIIDDGQITTEDDLDEGDLKMYRAVKDFKIKIGNAGGVDIQYNGKSLGVLGVTGQVLELNLPMAADSTSINDPS